METFQLVFTGKRCGNYSKLPIDEHLALLKFPENSRKKIISSNAIALKRNLDHTNAIKQQKYFISIGLETTLKLELNEQLFRLGFKKNKESIESELSLPDDHSTPEKVTTDNDHSTNFDESKIYVVEKDFTNPILFSRPGVYQIEDNQFIELNSFSYLFRGLALLAASIYIGLTLQRYLVLFVLNLGAPNTLATIIGIIFFFVTVIGLPKIIQPLQYFELSNGQKSVQVIEKLSFLFGRHNATLLDEKSNHHGEFSFKANSAQAHVENTSYQWNSRLIINDTNLDSLTSIQNSILDETALGDIITIIKHFLKAFKMFSNQPNVIDWKKQTPSVITDSNNNVVALIYNKINKAYYITDKELENDLVLHAFCSYILRDRLI